MKPRAHKLENREDGLAYCGVCHGGESSLPSECPGVRMTLTEQDAVSNGELDFKEGLWVYLP